MPTLHIKPASPDLIVRDPYTKKALPKEGKVVPYDPYWIRRLKAGDVVNVETQADPPSVSVEPQTEPEDTGGEYYGY